MRSIIEKILFCQASYSNKNTPMMKKRGELIRYDLPSALSNLAESVKMKVEGRDGTGQKSRVPWVRIYHPDLSPSARDGWYIVFLFNEDASGVACSLNQGTTSFIDGVYIPDDDVILQSRVNWAKQELIAKKISISDLTESIELGNNTLANAYEKGHVVGYEYSVDNIPNDETLFNHLNRLLTYLQILYSSEARITIFDQEDPLVSTLTYEIDEMAGKGRISETPAPFRVNAAERRAIEYYAMDVVKKHFSESGWSIEDTHKNKPYDLVVKLNSKIMYVEIKGTTSFGKKIILTPNEVRHHQTHFPNTCLAIVKNICIDTTGEPACYAGELELHHPWKPDEIDLKPMAFEYSVP